MVPINYNAQNTIDITITIQKEKKKKFVTLESGLLVTISSETFSR